MPTNEATRRIREHLNIPTLPRVLARVGMLLDDPECGTREIGELVAQDAPLAARVLRIANSAFYGLRERCLSTEQACSVLGMRVLRNVVLQAAVIQQFDHLRKYTEFRIDDLWTHSVLVAQVCAKLAEHSQRALDLQPEEFYTCGLLHDIGKVVMLDCLRDEYLDCHRLSGVLGDRMHHAEKKRFGFHHCDVGAMVAARWGLPPAAISAIQYHHGPVENLILDPVAALVANANLLATRVSGGRLDEAERTLDQETADFLELRPGDVAAILAFSSDAASRIET